LSRDIFQFWSEISEDAYAHPADHCVLERCEHHFDRDCLPGAYRGRLRSAAVVLLFLSPGLDSDDAAHCATEQGRHYYARQRTGECDLPDEKEHPSAYKWLTRIIKQFGIEYDQARSTVATLNIGAYKSRTFNDYPMLAALPSSRVCLDWAQSVLFAQAEAGERIVVCLRSPRYWGLQIGEPVGSLFSPQCGRNAIMHNGEMRERVKAAVQRAMLPDKNSN
jgi:hypothetical protein